MLLLSRADVRVNKMKLVLRAKVLFELANYFTAFDVLKNKLVQLKNEHFKESLRLDALPGLLDVEGTALLEEEDVASMNGVLTYVNFMIFLLFVCCCDFVCILVACLRSSSDSLETKFKIDIATPTIIIPRSSSSHSVLQCNLGHIKIESSFSHVEQPAEEV
jgi:hypothetical protein